MPLLDKHLVNHSVLTHLLAPCLLLTNPNVTLPNHVPWYMQKLIRTRPTHPPRSPPNATTLFVQSSFVQGPHYDICWVMPRPGCVLVLPPDQATGSLKGGPISSTCGLGPAHRKCPHIQLFYLIK